METEHLIGKDVKTPSAALFLKEQKGTEHMRD